MESMHYSFEMNLTSGKCIGLSEIEEEIGRVMATYDVKTFTLTITTWLVLSECTEMGVGKCLLRRFMNEWIIYYGTPRVVHLRCGSNDWFADWLVKHFEIEPTDSFVTIDVEKFLDYLEVKGDLFKADNYSLWKKANSFSLCAGDAKRDKDYSHAILFSYRASLYYLALLARIVCGEVPGGSIAQMYAICLSQIPVLETMATQTQLLWFIYVNTFRNDSNTDALTKANARHAYIGMKYIKQTTMDLLQEYPETFGYLTLSLFGCLFKECSVEDMTFFYHKPMSTTDYYYKPRDKKDPIDSTAMYLISKYECCQYHPGMPVELPYSFVRAVSRTAIGIRFVGKDCDLSPYKNFIVAELTVKTDSSKAYNKPDAKYSMDFEGVLRKAAYGAIKPKNDSVTIYVLYVLKGNSFFDVACFVQRPNFVLLTIGHYSGDAIAEDMNLYEVDWLGSDKTKPSVWRGLLGL